jgi:hypothetical protein
MPRNKNKKGQNVQQKKQVQTPKKQQMPVANPQKKKKNFNNKKKNFNKKQYTKMQVASGVITTLQVDVSFDPLSFTAIPLGLISRGLTRGGLYPYAAFFVMYSDIVNIAGGGTGVAPSRLAYMNSILNSLSPKSVPFRKNYKIAYNIENLVTTVPSSNIPLDGGFVYYMYNPSNAMVGLWNVQAAPVVPTLESARAFYIDFLTRLASNCQHNRLTRDVNLTASYLYDTSAFARTAPYFGYGVGVGGPFSSIENEVPFKNKYLGCLVRFDNTTPRASRFLVPSSGDSTCNWGLGSLDSFPEDLYCSAVTSIFKFIDVGEIVEVLTLYLKNLIEIRLVANPPQDPIELQKITDQFVPQNVSYTAFMIMIIQQLKWMFSDSQNLAQFLSPQSVGAGNFQAFLCGSNTFPADPQDIINVPVVFNENMKMLKFIVRPYLTDSYQVNKNAYPHVPVLGTWKTWSPKLVNVSYGGVDYPMFAPEYASNPSIFDGTLGGQAVDFNNSNIISVATGRWNELILDNKAISSALTPLGGTCPGSPLLQYTRYVNFPVVQDVDCSLHYTSYVESNIVTKKREVTRQTSRGSKEVEKIIDRYYAPPVYSMGSQITVAYSAMLNISPSMKSYMSSFILPVVELVTNQLPSQSQYQEAVYEPVSLRGNGSLPTKSRGVEINLDVVQNYIRGLAGTESDLAQFILKLSRDNEGSVLGDIFNTIGSVAEKVGVPVVGPAARITGSVLSGIGL